MQSRRSLQNFSVSTDLNSLQVRYLWSALSESYEVTDIGNMSFIGVFVSIKGLSESDEFEINHV